MRDVRVVQRRERLGFALESGQPFEIAPERVRQNFDRDVTVELGIARAIHLTHAAGAERRDNLERAEAHAGGQRHESRPIVATGPVAAKGDTIPESFFRRRE